MPVNTETNKVNRVSGGSVTRFSFAPLAIYDESEIELVITENATGVETTPSLGTGPMNYAVYPVGGSLPSNVALEGEVAYPADEVTPLASGYTLTLRYKLPLTQEIEFENQGGYYPETIEEAVDRNTRQNQQQQEQLDRAILSPAVDSDPLSVPSASVRSNKFAAWDSTGNFIATEGGPDSQYPVSEPFGADIISAASATDALINVLGFSSYMESLKSTVSKQALQAELDTFITDAAVNTITWEDSSALIGPTIELKRNSASPSANDLLGEIKFIGKNSAAADTVYAQIYSKILDPLNSTEDSVVQINTQSNGTIDTRMFIGNGMWMTGSTGGDQGSGTINTTGVYKNGVEYTQAWTYEPAVTLNSSFHNLSTTVPAWVTEIEVILSSVSASANTNFLIQIGTAGSTSSSGYSSATLSIVNGNTVVGSGRTDGFQVTEPTYTGAAAEVTGKISLTRWDPTGFQWISSGVLTYNPGVVWPSSGTKTLDGELARVVIRTTSAPVFDGGQARIRYR